MKKERHPRHCASLCHKVHFFPAMFDDHHNGIAMLDDLHPVSPSFGASFRHNNGMDRAAFPTCCGFPPVCTSTKIAAENWHSQILFSLLGTQKSSLICLMTQPPISSTIRTTQYNS